MGIKKFLAKPLNGFGAGEGNRTLVFSLEGCCSTIELHPRARVQLSRHAGRLNRYARFGAAGGPLNMRRFHAYTGVSINQRKEVIQCLSPSAVTSLGSPARLLSLASGRLSPGPASYKGWDATGAIPSRLFVSGTVIAWRCQRIRAKRGPMTGSASNPK
jgi:hypothetical protein